MILYFFPGTPQLDIGNRGGGMGNRGGRGVNGGTVLEIFLL